MPQGTFFERAYWIWRLMMSLLVWLRIEPCGSFITSGGIRYSNIEPDQDISAPLKPISTIGRPSRNQCSVGRSPLAMANRLVSRASEASRS